VEDATSLRRLPSDTFDFAIGGIPVTPEAQLERKLEGVWACKDGMRWFHGANLVGEHASDLTLVYGSRRSFHKEAALRGKGLRGTIFGGQTPQVPGPLASGREVERRPMGTVLRQGDFRNFGTEVHPRFGRVVRIEGCEWPAMTDATTVVLIASERGYLPVRLEPYLPKARTPLTVMASLAIEQTGKLWFPVALRQETRLGGVRRTDLNATHIHVNDVPDTKFRVVWNQPGRVDEKTTNTALTIGKRGQLELDPRNSRLPIRHDPNMVLRMAAALVLYAVI